MTGGDSRWQEVTAQRDTSPAPPDTNPEVQHHTVQLERLLQVQLQGHALHTCGHRAAPSRGHTGTWDSTQSLPPFLPIRGAQPHSLSPRGGVGSSLCPVAPVSLTVLGLPPARAAGRGQHVLHAVPAVAVGQPRVTPAAFHAPLQRKGQRE